VNRREFSLSAVALLATLETVAVAALERPTDCLEELVKEGIAPGAADR